MGCSTFVDCIIFLLPFAVLCQSIFLPICPSHWLFAHLGIAIPGDEDLRAALERRVSEFDPSTYWSTAPFSLSSIAASNLAASPPPAAPTKRLYNPHEGSLNGRQLSESIPDFLSRLPPFTTTVSTIGPWIWIANPSSDDRPLNHDLAGFRKAGQGILDDLSVALAATQAELKANPTASLARQLTLTRSRATERILAAAKHHAVTSGKWMLFPTPADVNSVWRLVATATASGHLGSGAKVAAAPGDDRVRLICVYTADFSHQGDLRRVLAHLDELGLVRAKGTWGVERGIYYKCGEWRFFSFGSEQSGNELENSRIIPTPMHTIHTISIFNSPTRPPR